MNLDATILSLITFLPAVAAIALALMPRNHQAIRWFALVASIVVFVVSLHLPFNFDGAKTGFQFETDVQWISSPNIRYHMGTDGISMWLVVLTTFLMPFCVLVSWSYIKDRVKEFFVLMLLLESAMIGVFFALDLFLFYVFWEATLIPMALLIGMYGHERRVYAAVKFFLYTMVASVFMLAAIIWLYVNTGSFDYSAIKAALQTGSLAGLSSTAATWLFLGFFVAFAVKVPLWPLHTWLPDAHVEAPTAGSVLLAGVLLKMGTYGLLRFNVGLFPEASREHAWWIVTLALIGIVYGALVALVQPNMKKLIAYSSVSHLGFVVLGIFTFNEFAVNGAVFQMLAHGISTGALFMLAGMLYERRHSYEIRELGGLATPMPLYATFFLIITLASIGLPLLNGFVGEFMVLSGTFRTNLWWGIIATSAVIWSAGYMLWMYQRVFYGVIRDGHNAHLPDVNARERLALWPMAVAALIMGVAPTVWLSSIDPAVRLTVSPQAQVTTTQVTGR